MSVGEAAVTASREPDTVKDLVAAMHNVIENSLRHDSHAQRVLRGLLTRLEALL